LGLITGYSQNKFISAEEVYSKIRREFKSFTSSNLIDEGEFPVYTKEVLDKLGMSAMQECEAVLDMEEKKHILPYNYYQLHSAYKVTPSISVHDPIWHAQNSITVRNDTTCESFVVDKCTLDCAYEEKILQKVTVQQFVKDESFTKDYNSPILLRLSPNVHSMCADTASNINRSSIFEISINNGYIYSNFDNDSIYMKYYGLAVDDDGLPMIPDKPEVKKAVEWWIKYQLLLTWWFNGDVQDIQNKWGKAEQLYEAAMAECRYLDKLPSFSEMVNAIRNQRANNKVTFFKNQYRRP